MSAVQRPGIVVGTDGSPAAEAVVGQAAMLAVGFGAALHIVAAAESRLPAVPCRVGCYVDDYGLPVELHATVGNLLEAVAETAKRVAAERVVIDRAPANPIERLMGAIRWRLAGGPRPIQVIDLSSEPERLACEVRRRGGSVSHQRRRRPAYAGTAALRRQPPAGL